MRAMLEMLEMLDMMCINPFQHSLIYGSSSLFLAARVMIDEARELEWADMYVQYNTIP